MLIKNLGWNWGRETCNEISIKNRVKDLEQTKENKIKIRVGTKETDGGREKIDRIRVKFLYSVFVR